MVWSLRSDKEKRGDFEKQIAAEENTLLIGSMPSEQGINASSGIVTAGVILLAPEEQVGYLSGIEPAMLAASPPAIDMSETAKMEPEVQVFVADEQARNVSAGQSMPAAAVPAMTAAERILSMVPQVGNLSDSGQSTPASTVYPKMIAAITADSAGGQGVVILQ